MDYSFSTLNDKDFEQIAKDLLNAKFHLGLQDFKIGKDKGRDLRFSTPENDNSIVVQAKHYIGSKFAQLKHTLLKTELDKIKTLNPDRYIVVTSLPLSASQKDELKSLLAPFVLTSNDIIGREDLNGYLSEFKEIETKYYKLWFSSTNILNSIMNNAVEGRTRYLLERIQDKIPFYVITKKIEEANKILHKKKLLLITGNPGVGKTTLAEMILFEKAKEGYKIYKVENIREAEEVISPDRDEKQLFYFDDFLGSNYLEILNSNKTETQLTFFLERVKNTPNKYLVLTTRIVILKQALEKYEKISHSNINDSRLEIELKDYTKYEKALILYNHLYFKKVPKNLYESILKDKFYMEIINHDSYIPRIIEFITDKSRIEKLSPKQYLQFILDHLENPEEIWRHSFNNQISDPERFLLLTLFTFEWDCSETILLKAFENRLNLEKQERSHIIRSNQFNESLKILLDGFIKCTVYNAQPEVRKFSFINPSLKDFLIGYVNDSLQEQKAMISSLTYVEQLTRFDPEKKLRPLEKELQIIIREKIRNSLLEVEERKNEYFTSSKRNAIFSEILCKYCSEIDKDALLLEHLKQISFAESWFTIEDEIEFLLSNLEDSPKSFDYIKENFIRIIEKFMDNISAYEIARDIPYLFEKFGHSYENYRQTYTGFNKLLKLTKDILTIHEKHIESSWEDEVTNFDQVDDLYNELRNLGSDLKNKLFANLTNIDFEINFDESYWIEKIEENISKKNKIQADRNFQISYLMNLLTDDDNVETAIDDLFSKKI